MGRMSDVGRGGLIKVGVWAEKVWSEGDGAGIVSGYRSCGGVEV